MALREFAFPSDPTLAKWSPLGAYRTSKANLVCVLIVWSAEREEGCVQLSFTASCHWHGRETLGETTRCSSYLIVPIGCP